MTSLTTEQRNANSAKIDTLSAREIVELMNREDAGIAAAVASQTSVIAESVDCIANALRDGGRLFYQGAGTSGRLGVLDASECPPTFSTPPELVVGLIAGGRTALTTAVEGAEDDRELAKRDLETHSFGSKDVLVGIAASGRTPYVLGGLAHARGLGATTIGLTCNADSAMHGQADMLICPVVGPEVISGSTRLKAGTATKMVLNMLTTGAMVRIGKTYGNLMVDLRASNTKLKERSVRIVREITGLDHEQASRRLTECDGEVKVAIVTELAGVSPAVARTRLTTANGQLRVALDGKAQDGGSRNS